MKRNLTTRWSLLASVAMLLATTITARSDEPATTPESPTEKSVEVIIQEKEMPDAPEPAGELLQPKVVVEENKSADGSASATITLDIDVVKPGQYWLGIMCTPVEDALLLAHLGIEHGIVVQEVVNDSPAAKAGLQKQDILIQAGDQALTDLKTLVAKTEATGEKALTLTLIRKGQRQTVEVTPVKRPAESSVTSATPDKEAADEWKMLQETLRRHQGPQIIEQEETQPDGTRMLFVMPGFVLPDKAKDFPKNLEVTITKKGDESAKITVQRGDDQWEVDANSLDKLPDDIRPHVQQMLGGGFSVTVGDGGFNWSSSLPKSLVLPKVSPDILKKSFKVAPNLRKKIELELKDAQEKLEQAQTAIPAETLDKIQQELKELREQIEKLRAERAEKAEAEKAEADDQEADQGT